MKEFGVVRVFLTIQRDLIVIKKVKNLQILINEVQKKTKQNKKWTSWCRKTLSMHTENAKK